MVESVLKIMRVRFCALMKHFSRIKLARVLFDDAGRIVGLAPFEEVVTPFVGAAIGDVDRVGTLAPWLVVGYVTGDATDFSEALVPIFA